MLRSLGDEILGNGKGGGFPWLREHIIGVYHPQCYQHFPVTSHDASIVNAFGDSIPVEPKKGWLFYLSEKDK